MTSLKFEREEIMVNFDSGKQSLRFKLSDVKRSYEREVYSLMTLLSDFGGFNDGVTLLPAILMGMYNAKMYYAAKTSLFPIKNKKGTEKRN